MPVQRKIRVMVSSRNHDPIRYGGTDVPLSDVRATIVSMIEGTRLFEMTLFEVWTNEDAVENAELTARETCLKRVAEADIVIILYNGRSGWATHEGGIGICHEEFQRAVMGGPQRAYVIELPKLDSENGAQERDATFASDLKTQQKWHKSAKTGEAVIKRVQEALTHALPELVHKRATASSLGGEIVGETLAWNELDLERRQQSIKAIVESFLSTEHGAKVVDGTYIVPFNGVLVACVPNAIPDSLSLAAARERVGQIFRDDDRLLPAKGAVGPLHIIGCYRSVTEASARRLYGVEDATYIALGSGMFIRDMKLKVQMMLVAKCEDTAATRAALQNFFDWTERSGQAVVIAQNAKEREVIVRAMQRVNRSR